MGWQTILPAGFSLVVIWLTSCAETSPTLVQSTPAPDTGQLIVGGQPVTQDYGFMVGLFDLNRSSLPYCGGSLIDGNTVLTAAHCVALPSYLEVEDLDIHIWVGNQDVSAVTADHLIPVREQILVPGWTNDQLPPILSLYATAADLYAGRDVALLQLDPQTPEQVDQLNSLPKVELIAPSHRPSRPAQTAVAIGWGLLGNDAGQPTQLQELELALLTPAQCQIRFPPAPLGEGVLCAGHRPPDTLPWVPPEELIGVCSGDSGSPLVIDGSTQIGITSFVLGLPPGCTRRIGYSGFVRLSDPSINRFIRRNARSNGVEARLEVGTI